MPRRSLHAAHPAALRTAGTVTLRCSCCAKDRPGRQCPGVRTDRADGASLRTGHHSTVRAGQQRRRDSTALRKADAALRLALPWQRLEKVWRGKAGRRDSGRRRRAITDCARALGIAGGQTMDDDELEYVGFGPRVGAPPTTPCPSGSAPRQSPVDPTCWRPAWANSSRYRCGRPASPQSVGSHPWTAAGSLRRAATGTVSRIDCEEWHRLQLLAGPAVDTTQSRRRDAGLRRHPSAGHADGTAAQGASESADQSASA